MNQARTYPQGVTSWVDVECRDMEAAMAFYGGLFGWTFADAPSSGTENRSVIAKLGGAEAAGVTASVDRPSEQAVWRTYVAVDDADAAAARIVAAGGLLLDKPTQVGEEGRSVTCSDPLGVSFRLWQARRRLGAQVANTPGAWNFSELHTADPATSAAFYSEVFGWSFDDLGFATLIRVPGYGDHLKSTVDPDIYARQEGVVAPPGFADATAWLTPVGPDEEPHWHVAFTVADRDTTATTASRLGGTVLKSSDSDWTRDALIRDPQGAVFTASQFTPPTGER
ncbi:MAG: VOC family protein [Candidatus Nanopelagicales bacterium]